MDDGGDGELSRKKKAESLYYTINWHAAPAALTM
jgi:hypothetical protein